MIHSKRTLIIDGIGLTFRRSIVGWMTTFGEDYTIVLYQVGNKWIAKRHRGSLGAAVEPIAVADTMNDALGMAVNHYACLNRVALL